MPHPLFPPSPRTWAPKMPVKSTYLRPDAARCVALLNGRPMFIATQATQQAIANATDVPLTFDTEVYDNYFGHLTTSSPANYYGIVPGWYLAQGTAGIDYTGGTGAVKTGIGLSAAGGTLTTWYGQRMPASGTASRFPFAAVAKLVPFTSVGRQGGPANDYAALVLNQTSGSSQNSHSGTNQVPQLQLWWVAASTGTAPLPVPANPAWPVPPAIVTSAFLNANVRDAVSFLIYPPFMEAYYAAGTQTLASQASPPATGTQVLLDTTRADSYGAFSAHTWTAPVAGVYWCYFQTHQVMNATSLSLAAGLTVTSANYNGGTQVTLWGGTQAAYTSSDMGNCAIARRRLRLNAGDTIAGAAFQHDSGTATTTLGFTGGTAVSESRLITIWTGA